MKRQYEINRYTIMIHWYARLILLDKEESKSEVMIRKNRQNYSATNKY